jgi:hypothetical protein
LTNILGGGPNAKQQQLAGSLRFQASQAGGVIPLVYGTTRVSPILLDYQDFEAHGGSAGKGKGGGGGTPVGGGTTSGKAGKGSQTQYSASFILGVCQGPIAAFANVWYNKSITFLSDFDGVATINLGADAQPADPYWVTNHSDNAIGYSGTANATFDNYNLGPSASLPNFGFEVYGIESSSGINTFDANPAAIVTDFLTNPRYGANFPAANLDSLASYQAYCTALGIGLSPVLDAQQAASQSLSTLVQLTNAAVVWSGGLLKIIPYGDQPISTAFTLVAMSGPPAAGDEIVIIFSGGALGSPVTVNYYAAAANTNADTVYTASFAGAICAMIAGHGTLQAAKVFASVTPTGLMILDQSGSGIGVSASISGTGGEGITASPLGTYSWSPYTVPAYNLDDDDFIVQESTVGSYLGVTPGTAALRQGATPVTGGFTDDPVHIQRSSPADANNWVEIEVNDRHNSYNRWPVAAFDQGMIDQYGVRKGSTANGNAVTDPYYVGPIVAQLVLQRAVHYRNTYSFSLGWNYCLLEPMDLVQISDPYLGAGSITVRITGVREDQEGTLAITAEDFFGMAGSVLYPKSGPPAIPLPNAVRSLGLGAGTALPAPHQASAATASTPVYNAAAPSVNTPFILEPTGQLLAAQGLSSPQVIIGLSGGPGGTYSPLWGGAQVWASLDGTNFGQPFPGDVFNGVSTMGVVTSDAVTSLSVNLAESNGSLQSVSAITAAKNVALCAVRGPGGLEFLSFTTATLTGANQYTLSGLNRGLYGTPQISQPAGAQFLYLGAGEYFAQTLPTNYVGQTISFKFPSFNTVGSGQQSLADAAAYIYTPQGAQVNPATFPILVARGMPIAAELRSNTVRRDMPIQAESR